MSSQSEKYRAIADLLAYAEQWEWEQYPTVTDDGKTIEISEALYQDLVSSPEASTLLDKVKACGVEISRYNEEGYFSDNDEIYIV